MLSSRYEYKYLIPDSLVGPIRQYIQPFVELDPYAPRGEDHSYPIVSLYLDSPDLHLYRQTAEGMKDRFKLRIRSYKDGVHEPVYVEIKHRYNDVLKKTRAQLWQHQLHQLFEAPADWIHELAEPDLHATGEFLSLASRIQAKPVVLVRYMREAYNASVGEPVRITFDRELCHRMTDRPEVSPNGAGWTHTGLNDVILEIKFTERFPMWLNRMSQHFGLRRTSVPKYVLSVEHARRVRGLGRVG